MFCYLGEKNIDMDIQLEFQTVSFNAFLKQRQFYLTVLGKEQKYMHTHITKIMQQCNHFFRARWEETLAYRFSKFACGGGSVYKRQKKKKKQCIYYLSVSKPGKMYSEHNTKAMQTMS